MASSFDPAAVETFIDNGDLFVASYKSVLLQVRRGPLTMQALDHLESIIHLARTRNQHKGGAYLGVLEESAELTGGDVRARQTVLFRKMLSYDRSYAATVVLTSATKGALLRTFMRMVAFGNPQLGIFGNALEAGRWLEKRVEMPALETTALVEWGRTKSVAQRRASGI
ncbi:hypothetical protein AKJ09_06315 [Labilithrix luteola]|uniref:STAS/SEC14 domain-containing protein n=1 Tax=Labilithrix luteola TaxID=1391654 RepID=A0A0K1Q1X2_9BACT|nr:hypothetical protein [Labilithrix luteola]AKU99651.1 hypothetical protein AKJ09_06315 [Labilithrix luteola]